MAVFLDLVGSQFQETVTEQSVYSRRFHVNNLTATTALQAISVALTQLPQPGDVLDATFFNLMFLVSRNVDRVECDHDNSNQMSVYGVLEYATVDQTQAQNPLPDDNGTPVVTSGSAIETIQTVRNQDGSLITVPPPPSKAGEADYVPIIQLDIPASVKTFRRLESSDPQIRSDTYQGRLNSLTWKGVAPGFAKCNRIQGTTNNGGASYDVFYEFAIAPPDRPGGWQPEAVWVDENGRIPPDLDFGLSQGGIITTSAPTANFNDLNL